MRFDLRIFSYFVLLVAGVAFANGNLPKYFYEPTVSTIKGILKKTVFPGPPNYESVKKGDAAEGAWLLSLSKPISVIYDGKDGDPTSINETETDVAMIQLATGEDRNFKMLRASLGKQISCTGTLFHRHTGHHRTRVLMYLGSCKPTDS